MERNGALKVEDELLDSTMSETRTLSTGFLILELLPV